MEAFYGILIPFLGTSLGAACVFFMKKSLSDAVQRSLTGFAAGVMVAASVWSLLIPAIEQSSAMGKLSFLPAFLGRSGTAAETKRQNSKKIIKKMGFYLVIFKKSLSTKNQDIKYNHLITNILHSIKIIYFY